jgi:hypothetical protein
MEDTHLAPIYCIAAHVPAIKAPGLGSHVGKYHNAQVEESETYRDPDMLGLAYTPPV